MSKSRNTKRGTQDGDVTTENILPKGTGRGGRTPNKRAKGIVEEEKEREEKSEVMELLGRIEQEFQVEEEKKEEEEEEEEEEEKEMYNPPSNQEQEENNEEGKEEKKRKEGEVEVESVKKSKEEENDISSEEEEETVELRRVYENFDEKLEPIQSFNTEYQAELARGKVEIPGDTRRGKNLASATWDE